MGIGGGDIQLEWISDPCGWKFIHVDTVFGADIYELEDYRVDDGD